MVTTVEGKVRRSRGGVIALFGAFLDAVAANGAPAGAGGVADIAGFEQTAAIASIA